MCGRYALFQTEKLEERFRLINGLPTDVTARYNISPSQLAPVIIDRSGTPTVELMKWGFIPHGAKDANSVFRYKTFNARSEKVFEKTMWKNAIRYSRCLVPTNGFYEWKTTSDGKQPYFIRPQDTELFALAGLHATWRDPDGNDWGTFSIITTEASRDMKPVHDRMPVILKPETEVAWLDSSIDDMNLLYDLMRPYPDGQLILSEVSRDVNSPRLDNKQLIQPFRTHENTAA